MSGFCDRGNQLSAYEKGVEFINQLRDYQLFMRFDVRVTFVMHFILKVLSVFARNIGDNYFV